MERLFWRPIRRWKDNIKMDLKELRVKSGKYIQLIPDIVE
jgi:hypothetical protein